MKILSWNTYKSLRGSFLQKIKKLTSSHRSASRLEEERLKAVQELEEVKITFISKVFFPLELPAMIQGASVKSFERQPIFSGVLSPHLVGCLEWIKSTSFKWIMFEY